MFVVVVLAALVGADLVARRVAEDQLRQQVVAKVQPDGPVSASISSFPFVGRLLLSGTIPEVKVSLADVTVRGFTFASVGVVLESVRIDRDALVQDRRVALLGIGRGTAVVEISADEISRLVKVPVVLETGRARVRLNGRLVDVAARVEGSRLVVAAAGVTLGAVDIPPLPLVSCLSGTEIRPGRLRLTCSIDEVPVELAGRSLQTRL
ncbi:MAG: LmeA-like phospholipid-binding [Actinomycetota bacterium]|nr:LmeA-like phospholipid-binding [Actinomycetota bacterium]